MFILRANECNMIESRTTITHLSRYLQADAHRQEVRTVRELDGGARDAVIATANGKPGIESRAIHPATRGAAGHVEQHRKASVISVKTERGN